MLLKQTNSPNMMPNELTALAQNTNNNISRRHFLQIATVTTASLLGGGASLPAQSSPAFSATGSAREGEPFPVTAPPLKITIFSPSGAVPHESYLRRAARQLEFMGAQVHIDEDAAARSQYFAGSDDTRLASINRVTQSDCDVALASRGGYGLSRLLGDIQWAQVAQSVDQGKRWVGHSDFTAFQLALLARTGRHSWAGPMAMPDFALVQGLSGYASTLDTTTSQSFMQTMRGKWKTAHFTTTEGFNGLSTQGILWGGNLSVLCSMLATPNWPDITGGILFLEDVNERPSRIERMLMQLHHAGVLQQQKAILMGDFGTLAFSNIDRGYQLPNTIAYLRQICNTPILTGLPFGHINTKLTLPIGLHSTLTVREREAIIDWSQAQGQGSRIHKPCS